HAPVDPRRVHSFPTRRSSDLVCRATADCFCTGTDCALVGRGGCAADCDSASAPPGPDCPRTAGTEFAISLIRTVVARKLSGAHGDRKSTRLNSSHVKISYAVF